MERKRGDVPSNLMRCPSLISTTDGGLTPQTDLSSPLVRSPSVFVAKPEEASGIVASTNLVRLCLVEGYRVHEYTVNGSVDLVSLCYERLKRELGTTRILMIPNRDQTTVLAVTNQAATRLQISVDGVTLQFARSHEPGCWCIICMKGFSHIIERGTKIGKYESLCFDSQLPTAVSRSVVAIPVQRLKLVRETGALTLACDSLVKWLPWGKQSVADLLRLATLQGKTRVETNLILAQSWIYTIYNGKPYRIKKIWFDMTPLSCFFDKKTGETISYASFVEKRYGMKAICVSSPMIEAVAEKRAETCFLVPELCFVLRPSPNGVPMHTVHAQTRTKTRSACIDSIVENVLVKEKFETVVDVRPVQVIGDLMSRPVRLSVLPCRRSAILPTAHRWSLVLIGASNFSPSWLIYNVFDGQSPAIILSCGSNQGAAAVVRRAAQGSEMIVVVLKTKSSVYATVKYVSLVECGVPCQVILADTIERESARVDLTSQIRAKLFFAQTPSCPDNVIGLDFHRFGDVSVFTIAWKSAYKIEVRYCIDQSGSALTEPEMMDRYLVLLGSELWRLPVDPVIIMACRRGIPSSSPLAVDPRLRNMFGDDFSLIIACVKSDVRLFSSEGNDVDPGFAFDVPGGFYLVPHRVEQGNALPVLFLVVVGHLQSDVLKKIVYRSYGSDETRRLPEVFRHTLKLSEMIGIHLRKSAGRGGDLVKCLEASQAWKDLLKRTSSYFYL